MGATNTSNTMRSNAGVAPSNFAAANLAASLAAGAQQKVMVDIPATVKIQAIQPQPTLKIKQEPSGE